MINIILLLLIFILYFIFTLVPPINSKIAEVAVNFSIFKMPFIGRDWRAPGETWVRTPHTNGWERTKLRPVQVRIFF